MSTRDEVLDGLEWIHKETTSKDVAMVFLAGHGVNHQNGPMGGARESYGIHQV